MAVQSSLFSVLPDSTPLDPSIVLWGDPRWDAAIAELEEAQVIGFDLETFGPNPEDGLNPWKGEIRLIGAGLPSGLSLVADLGAAHEDRRARAERERGLPQTRPPDPGFMAVCHGWASGRDLGGLIEGEMSGGDFVRTTKQLIDVLRQLALVAPDRATRANADRAASSARSTIGSSNSPRARSNGANA